MKLKSLRAFALAVACGFACAAGAQSYAKTNPNKITFASNGEGGFPHMTIELLRVMAGFTYVKEKLVAAGLIVVTEPPEYFAATLKSDYAKYGKLIHDIGFQPQ
jgi:tripartite-type tricarboxylate transporter receptor subunit TctC